MTIPYLHNCPHGPEGWCLRCTGELGEEVERLKDEIRLIKADMREAAGGLPVSIPEHGTDAAKLLHANVMMRNYKIPELRAENERLRSDYEALMRLTVQPWTRDGDGAKLWKINLAWWDTEDSEAKARDRVRKVAGLEPERRQVESFDGREVG